MFISLSYRSPAIELGSIHLTVPLMYPSPHNSLVRGVVVESEVPPSFEAFKSLQELLGFLTHLGGSAEDETAAGSNRVMIPRSALPLFDDIHSLIAVRLIRFQQSKWVNSSDVGRAVCRSF